MYKELGTKGQRDFSFRTDAAWKAALRKNRAESVFVIDDEVGNV
jgi:hypothetical protein